MNIITPTTTAPTTKTSKPTLTSSERMLKVSEKIFKERPPNPAFMPVEHAVPNLGRVLELGQKPPKDALKLTINIRSDQGRRRSMEDAHFVQETEEYTCLGVFDGHGGVTVADYASLHFQENFMHMLAEAKGDVRQALDAWASRVNNEVFLQKGWEDKGSTAVICIINKKTHLIYTATIGDSEANIYRELSGVLKSIPLSAIRNWGHPKEAKRASEALENPDIATSWPRQEQHKSLRFPYAGRGLNVSRAIGDKRSAVLLNDKAGIIHKPKISVNELKLGDILVVACDGLKDFVSEDEIITHLKIENPAPRLVDVAVLKKQSIDNVTVMTVIVEATG